MIKTLRFSLVALLAMVANITFAQTTIDFTKQEAKLIDKVGYTLTVSGYTFKADKAGGKTVPTQNTNSKDLRNYAKNTLTISGAEMKTIVFNMSAAGKRQWADVTSTVGEVTIDKTNGKTYWSNPAGCTEVTFTVGDDNTYGTSTDKTSGQFDLSSVVMNGEIGSGEPGGSEKPEPPTVETVDNIAAFKALANNKTAVLTLKDAIVLFKNEYTTKSGATNIEYYVRDASGSIMFYNTDLEIAEGDVLNGTVEGTYKEYNNMPELVKSANTSLEKVTKSNGTVTAKDVTVADLTDNTYLCDLVYVKGAIIAEKDGEYTNYFITADDEKVMVYDKFKKGVTIPTDGAEYFVKGIFVTGKIGGKVVYELAPLAITSTTGINNITVAPNAQNDVIYNVAGQRVGKDYKGLVIINGKKVIK